MFYVQEESNQVCREDGILILQETRKSTMFATSGYGRVQYAKEKKWEMKDAHDSGNSSDYTFLHNNDKVSSRQRIWEIRFLGIR